MPHFHIFTVMALEIHVAYCPGYIYLQQQQQQRLFFHGQDQHKL